MSMTNGWLPEIDPPTSETPTSTPSEKNQLLQIGNLPMAVQ